ncbi:hypothetical protein KCU65_g5610, partial [Aureobasidium melanogenum]
MIHRVRKPEQDDLLVTQEEIRDTEALTWKPISLRLPFLVFVLLATCALIVVMQWLLYTSQTTGGVIFAPSINDLPLSKTFGYLYAPTIIAVVYGLLWSWIDLDIKRMEPYYQLCSTGGALAEDSLLLQYPFDFVALVPFQAARRKHWSVFTGGLAGIVVLWTLTPLQAGIFATEDRVVTTVMPFVTSTKYQPAYNQTEPSALYAQHAYNIAWLNEALPPYTTVDFVLDAFAPVPSHAIDEAEIWNGVTNLYGVDVICESTINFISSPDSDNPSTMYNSSSGCSYGLPVKTGTGNDTSKVLEVMYVGYSDQNGMADWYLEGYCPKKANHTFLVRTTLFTEAGIVDQNLASTTTPDNGVVRTTSLYCESQYFVQQVNASVAAANGSVISVSPIGQKSQLPEEIFDINLFERAMSSGLDYRGPGVSYDSGRGDFPENSWPDQKTHFLNTNLDMSYLPNMVPFSFAALKKPSLEDYLDSKTLAESYQAAYRLLFVAQMARVLESDFGTTATRHDAGDSELLTLLGNLDNSPAQGLRSALVGSKFSMDADAKLELQSGYPTDVSEDSDQDYTTPAKGVQSPELRWYSGVAFLSVQLTCIAVFAYLFHQAKINNGLALPSNNRFVRQLLQNYIPTAISTTLEPVWILLTRQLCVLQPFEELRKGKATSENSITLAYTNLTPQLVVFKALSTRHFLLGILATMTILANVLSVAFSSLFYEGLANAGVQTTLQASLSLPFQSLNGTAPPFNSNVTMNWQGGTTKDEFYIAMSNAMASSKLPSWTDPDRFYLPVSLPEYNQAGINYTVSTGYFGASLGCQQLNSWEIKDAKDKSGSAGSSFLKFNIIQTDDSITDCSIDFSMDPPAYISGPSSLEISTVAGSSGACKQHVVAGWWRGNASNQTIEVTSKTMMLCHPQLVTGSAEVIVDSEGQVLSSTILTSSNGSAAEYFTTHPSDLILQAHQSIIDHSSDWHNDSLPSDWNNYLIASTFVGDRFLDPHLQAPSFYQAVTVYTAMYNKLFAILLGNNADLLFSAPKPDTQPLPGIRHEHQTRIFLSFPAFVIAQGVLSLYALTTILVYLHRPWRILPRLPTTIASTIAFFAASYAVQEFEGV